MAINNHSGSCACEQCAPVPCTPCAPPPTCPTTACEEYILSDCVVSTIETDCTATWTPPGGQPVQVGLVIDEGTTLTNVYQQLTTTACIFNPNVIGAILQTIQNNPVLNNYFTDLICDASCDDPCEAIVPVSQVVFDNITTVGFSLTFLAQPNYNYSIRINDSNQIPITYYTWSSPNPPNVVAVAPISYTLNTSVFKKVVGAVTTTPPPPMTLIPGHTHEVYITAIGINGEECEAGPWTIITNEDPACPPNCDQIQITIAQDPAITTNLAFIVTFLQGPAFPVSYLANIYDSNGTNVIPPNSILTISNTPVPDPITSLYPTTATGYDYPAITADDTYSIEITPICSFQPLYCLGEMVDVDIQFTNAAACNPPDIVSVNIVS